MRRRLRQIAHGLVVLLGLSAGTALAQTASAQTASAFETLDVQLGAAADVQRGLYLYDVWTPGPGPTAGVTTPFYLGTAEVGGAAHRYRAREASAPDFDAVLAYVGWGVGAERGRLGVRGGVRVGIHRMTFDEDTFVGVRNESELALGAVARVRLRVAGDWALYSEATFMKTYTYIRMQQVWIAAGVSTRVTTPGWLRRVLQ